MGVNCIQSVEGLSRRKTDRPPRTRRNSASKWPSDLTNNIGSSLGFPTCLSTSDYGLLEFGFLLLWRTLFNTGHRNNFSVTLKLERPQGFFSACDKLLMSNTQYFLLENRILFYVKSACFSKIFFKMLENKKSATTMSLVV